MVAQARQQLKEKYQVDGFNIGVNDGIAAGQTIPHGHIHIIPRRREDVQDPKGASDGYSLTKQDTGERMSAPEEQVHFLVNLQRLLEEGQFVCTYKYALLLAFADISIEQGDGTDARLEIPTRSIAEKFIQYYWRQTLLYVPLAELGCKSRNTPALSHSVTHIRIAGSFATSGLATEEY